MTTLDYSPLTRQEISVYTSDPEWQEFLGELSRVSFTEKLNLLEDWLDEHEYSRASQVQVTNYINALRRAGYPV